jgi:tetratricopeptide (TPR) repeat protein
VGLLLFLAELEDLRGRYDQAIDLYREVLKAQPANVVALNNLAYFLALRKGEQEEALKLAEGLLAALGPVGEVLDTRGLIYQAAGRPDQAAKDFQAAVKQDPQAVKYFHLAQAQQAAGEQAAARSALARALGKGLKEESLHPLEQPAFRNLRSELLGP